MKIEAKLFEMLKVEELMNDAALALMLGGSPDTAARALAWFANKPAAARKPALDELGELWYKSFGYWSTEDLEAGLLFKYVKNAEAMARVSIAQTPQEWARLMLERQFDNLLYDNGPHSFTRVVLRHRLWQMAKGNDEAKREGAIHTLKFMKERGVLLALRNEAGPHQEAARQAYFELLNQKIVTGVTMPEISATRVRELAATGHLEPADGSPEAKELAALLPRDVLRYIATHRLYSS